MVRLIMVYCMWAGGSDRKVKSRTHFRKVNWEVGTHAETKICWRGWKKKETTNVKDMKTWQRRERRELTWKRKTDWALRH